MAKAPEESHSFYEQAGPTLLSMQPNTTEKKPQDGIDPREWSVLRGHLERRINQLRNWRQSWWSQNWSNIAEYLLPRRSIWLTQSTGGWPTPNNMTRGREINGSIKDPTATFALRVCSAGLMSGLASPSRPWFKITPGVKNAQIDAEGRKWLDEVEQRVYAVLASSNFYNSFAQECEDITAFGTAPSIIYEDDKDVIRCYNPAVGEYFLSAGATGRTDGLFRVFVFTVAQMVDFFGIEACPPEVQTMWAQKGGGLEMERIVAHAIEPNFDIEHCPKLPGGFTWRETYWVFGSGSPYPLSQRGFVDCPFTAARWSTQSNDAYGRSPGMDVLPDVIQLQVMTVRLSEAIEKQIRPPLIADMSMKNQPSSILPGHVTYVEALGSNNGMRPIYQVNPDINGLAALIQQVSQRIKVGLFNDLFLMLEQNPNQKMTAYEVAQKIQEKMQVLGPVIENIITESLKLKLRRVYGIMDRKNMIPEPPDSLKGMPLDIEFNSTLALAQKAGATGGLERIAALIGNLVAVYPGARNLLNEDEFIRTFNDLLANPQKILRSEDEVKEIKAAEAKAQADAQQQAAVANSVKTMAVGADAARTLSDTQIGAGKTALSELMGR